MANTIKHKRGSGSDPSASDLVAGELAIRTDTGVVFTKKDDGTVAQIAGGGDTDLGVSTTTTAVTVTSSTGNNATISEASSSAAGVMSAAHHDKLDGIEANATADQTAAEIRTLVESASDSNVFTDADHTKLNGIATGATANSTESIQDIVGGMVSGNSESGISVTYQDSDGTLDFSVTSQTDNNFTTTLKNKLDGIAAGAEVNVATNLGISFFSDSATISSSTGTNVSVTEASSSQAGLMSTAHHDKLDGIETGATADQTASEILTLLKTVDGSGSGLDADLLDGYTFGDFLRSNAADTKTSGHLTFNDSIKALFGTGSDLEIYHDGTNSNIVNNTGDLYLQGSGDDVIIRALDDIFIQPQNGEAGIYVFGNGAVELYYDNSNKLQTKSDGVNITGELECDSLDVDGAANVTGNLDISGDIRHNGDTNCLFGFPAVDTFRVSTGGTERFRITSTGAIAIEGSSNYGTSGQVLTSNGNDAPTWQDGGGTVASGCVYENSQTISANYSVTSGKNAMSAGPITIASGVTVTVTSGSTYTIV